MKLIEVVILCFMLCIFLSIYIQATYVITGLRQQNLEYTQKIMEVLHG